MPRPFKALRFWLLLAATVGVGACSEGKASAKPVARFDTLPTGRVTVVSSEPTGWSTPTQSWKFEDAGSVGGADGTPAELIEPGSVGVDAQGRIYVADRKPPVVKVFDSTGALIRVIGREGSGPGEFRVSFIAVRNGILAVHDPQQARTSVFDTAGTFIRSWKSSCCFWDDVYLDRAMRIYIPTMTLPDSTGKTRGRAFTRYTVEGKLVDTLWVPERPDEGKHWTVRSKDGKASMMTMVPFMPRLVNAFHPEGGFVYGWNNEFRLVRSAIGGADSSRIMSRSWTPDPLSDSLRQAKTDETLKWVSEQYGESVARAAIRVSDVPTTAPAFSTLRVDEDDNVWARRVIGSDSTRTGYDVFGADGSWLGSVTVPVGLQEYGGQLFGKGFVYAVAEDDEGRPKVKRLRIVR